MVRDRVERIVDLTLRKRSSFSSGITGYPYFINQTDNGQWEASDPLLLYDSTTSTLTLLDSNETI